MSWGAARKKRYPWTTKAEYDAHWVERVKARCVVDANGCWLWPGSKSLNGYAQTSYRSKGCRVHRTMFEIVNNVSLPSTVDVCHTCDVRHCVNPAHLWVGTRKDNVDDMTAKARHWSKVKTHCKRGHEFTPENTEIRQSRGKPGQGRACKTCQRARMRIAAGWPEDLAYSLPPTAPGAEPVGGKWRR